MALITIEHNFFFYFFVVQKWNNRAKIAPSYTRHLCHFTIGSVDVKTDLTRLMCSRLAGRRSLQGCSQLVLEWVCCQLWAWCLLTHYRIGPGLHFSSELKTNMRWLLPFRAWQILLRYTSPSEAVICFWLLKAACISSSAVWHVSLHVLWKQTLDTCHVGAGVIVREQFKKWERKVCNVVITFWSTTLRVTC